MYDELKERCRACSQGCIYPSECSYFDKPPLRCMRQLLSEAADAIEELTGFVQEAERDRDEYRERLDKANDAIEELVRKEKFHAFLWNTIQPNEMEQYLSMYRAQAVPSEPPKEE